MSRTAPSADDIYVALIERISAGSYTLGSRLPSCRALAAELDSNPSTVSRALQRLADDGLVRTEARRGTYVTATEPPEASSRSQIPSQLEKVVASARAAGFDADVIGEMFSEAVTSVFSTPTIAFVECNSFDLNKMSGVVENVTGLACKPLLIADVAVDWQDHYDVLAVPIFHLADLASVVDGLERVVELNFVPTATALSAIAKLSADSRVTVALPTERGVERVTSLVRQYYPGEVEVLMTDLDTVIDRVDADVLITTHALGLTDEHLAALPRVIIVDWELDPMSAATFVSRVESALSR